MSNQKLLLFPFIQGRILKSRFNRIDLLSLLPSLFCKHTNTLTSYRSSLNDAEYCSFKCEKDFVPGRVNILMQGTVARRVAVPFSSALCEVHNQ